MVCLGLTNQKIVLLQRPAGENKTCRVAFLFKALSCNHIFFFTLSLQMQDAEELGVIFIGTESKGYTVRECVPNNNARGNKWKNGVVVKTPERQFIFMCEQEQEQREWLQVLRQVLQRPMTPQDYAGKRGGINSIV